MLNKYIILQYLNSLDDLDKAGKILSTAYLMKNLAYNDKLTESILMPLVSTLHLLTAENKEANNVVQSLGHYITDNSE